MTRDGIIEAIRRVWSDASVAVVEDFDYQPSLAMVGVNRPTITLDQLISLSRLLGTTEIEVYPGAYTPIRLDIKWSR